MNVREAYDEIYAEYQLTDNDAAWNVFLSGWTARDKEVEELRAKILFLELGIAVIRDTVIDVTTEDRAWTRVKTSMRSMLSFIQAKSSDLGLKPGD